MTHNSITNLYVLIQNIPEIYPAVFSSPVNNLNNHIFAIFQANPLDACTRLEDPKLDNIFEIRDISFLAVIDFEIGDCGIRRRIQMVKNIGAKGVIILTKNLDHSVHPYGDYTDSTFLVFIADFNTAKSKLSPSKYLIATLTTSNNQETTSKPQLQLWVSTLDTKSYQLMNMWSDTLKQIPILKEKVQWKPRYALWGCSSGLYTPKSDCLQAKYVSTCACEGQFCSPETQFLAADAIIKEDIRQKSIYMKDQDKFLSYISNFTEVCLKKFQSNFYVEECAPGILENVGLNSTSILKQVQTFMNDCKGPLFQKLLLDRNRFAQIGSYPSAILDRTPIDFKTKKDFQIQICLKLGLEKEQGCSKVLKTNTIYNYTIDILFFILITIGLGLIVFGLVLVYRKTIKGWMHKEVKMQVSASVEHYFALTETK